MRYVIGDCLGCVGGGGGGGVGIGWRGSRLTGDGVFIFGMLTDTVPITLPLEMRFKFSG